MQEGEGDGEGGSLDRELRARGQRQPYFLDVGLVNEVEMVIVTTFVRYAEYMVMTREKLGDLVKVSQMHEHSWQQIWK